MGDRVFAPHRRVAPSLGQRGLRSLARQTLTASRISCLQNILDGKTSTRWTSPALGSEWIEVDFQISRPLQRIALDQTARPTEFPERYEVLVTDNPEQPGEVLASGTGEHNKTVIELPAGVPIGSGQRRREPAVDFILQPAHGERWKRAADVRNEG